MSDFFQYVRFDVVLVVVALVTVLLSAFRNQRNVGRNMVALIVALVVVGLPVVYDYAGLFTKLIENLNAHVFPTIDKYVSTSNTTGFHQLLVLLVVIIAVAILNGIIVGVARLIGVSDRDKYRKYPDYATRHMFIAGAIFGLVKALVFVYLLCIVYAFVVDYSAIDSSKEIIYDFFKSFDPVVKKIKTVIETVGV